MATITVTNPSHPSHLVKGFVAMRDAGELFDYVIRGSDELFSIHSLVLASVSPVFKTMLLSRMEESVNKEAVFPTIPDGTMRKIIHFCYVNRTNYVLTLQNQIINCFIQGIYTVLKYMQYSGGDRL